MLVADIDEHRAKFGVEPICLVLTEAGTKIAPSTYYAAKTRPPSARSVSDGVTTDVIRVVNEQNYGVYGVRKIHAELHRQGHQVARCTVHRLMKAAGLRGISRARGPRTTIPGTGPDTRPDLCRARRGGEPTAPSRGHRGPGRYAGGAALWWSPRALGAFRLIGGQAGPPLYRVKVGQMSTVAACETGPQRSRVPVSRILPSERTNMNSARSMAANAVVRLRLSNRPRAGRPARRAAAMFGVLAALIVPAVAACGFTTTSAPLAGATTADSNAAGASTPSVQKQAGIISRPVRVLFKNRTGNPLPTLFCGDLLYKSTCTAYEAANGGVIEFISDKVQVFVDPPEGSDPASAASFIIAGVNPSVGSPSVWLSSGITNQQLNDARETSRTNPIPYSENKYLYPNGYTQHYVDAETYTNPDIIFAGHRIYVERQKDDTYIGYVFEIRS